TAADAATINQFLQDFGYAAADFNNTAVTTKLNGSITNSQTSITVTSATSSIGFPTSGQFHIVVTNGSGNQEMMLVTSGAGTTTWTVARGVGGTTKAAASTNNTVVLATGPVLNGIYNSTSSPGTIPTSQTWPWPNDTGTALSTYLTT